MSENPGPECDSKTSQMSAPLTSTPKVKSFVPDLTISSSSESSVNEEVESEEVAQPTSSGVFKLPRPGYFLKPWDAMELIVNQSTPLLEKIPSGEKNNVYALIRNDTNIQRRKDGLHSQFWDDCGAWTSKSGSNKKVLFAKVGTTNRYLSVIKKKDEYCIKRSVDKKVVYVPLDPQPRHEDVLIIRQYYTTLKKSDLYRKRVTWLENIPSALSKGLESTYTTAIVEYAGEHPGFQDHGNAKPGHSKTSHYIRTNPEVLDKIREMCSQGKRPTEIFNVLQASDTEDEMDLTFHPRNVHQIHNKRHQINKMTREKSGLPPTGFMEFADGLQALLSMQAKEDPNKKYIRKVHSSSGKVVSVVLFTEVSINLIKQLCCKADNSTILGIDRTFNLADNLFVTVTSFKHVGLIRKKTGEPPIIIGPILLHGSADATIYREFLSDIAEGLGSSRQPYLVVGSDQEDAIRKAISKALPFIRNDLCTRHLK